MDDIERRGLPKYLTAYLNYKLGVVNSIPEELYKEVPNGLKECIDCMVNGEEVPNPDILASYPIYFKEEIIEEVEEHGGEKCATPVASPAGGTYNSTQTVTLSCATDGATIYYTTDGSKPTSESIEYTEAITVSSDTIIKAIAIKEEYENSEVSENSYTIEIVDYDTVPFDELDTYLKGKETNTTSTPYKIKITELTAADCSDSENEGTLGYILKQNSYKYVDLTPTTLPSDLTSMEKTFYECETLVKTPEIPNGVTNLSQTFEGCWCINQLPSIIPNSVTTLYRTFAGCSGVSEFPHIPSSVTSMLGANFEYCTSGELTIYCDIEDWTNVAVDAEEFLYTESEPYDVWMYVPSSEAASSLKAKLDPYWQTNIWAFSPDPHPNTIITSYDNLASTLATLYANTIENPYKIKITGLTSENFSDTMEAFENYKNKIYMDLSETELPNDLEDLSYAFSYFHCLTAAPTIPSSVTNMRNAFYYCDSLTAAPAIPSNATNLNSTFQGCTGLTDLSNITIPNSVTDMTFTFCGCTGLTDLSDLVISNSANINGTFAQCSSLTAAPAIPEGVSYLYQTFKGCSLLTIPPEIPSTATNMEYTFDECSSLTAAPTIPNGVTNLTNTFNKCSSLTAAPTIPSSVTNLSRTFAQCTGLTDLSGLTIPGTATNMNSTFSGCTGLTKAPIISNGITDMGNTFSGCTSLTKAPAIPSSVTNLNSTFERCSALSDLSDFTIPAGATSIYSLFSYCSSITDASHLVIPSAAKSMRYTFSNCTNLTAVPTIPEGITNLEDTFTGCRSLTSVPAIPSTTTDLDYTFEGCIGLTDLSGLTIPNGVTTLSSTFSGCTNLTATPTIPNNITGVNYTFKNCSSLVDIYFLVSDFTNVNINKNSFQSCTSLAHIYVPDQTAKDTLTTKLNDETLAAKIEIYNFS